MEEGGRKGEGNSGEREIGMVFRIARNGRWEELDAVEMRILSATCSDIALISQILPSPPLPSL
jgi:hypothetical protein